MIIDGKKIAEGLREKLKKKIIELKSNLKIAPGLSVILVGEDPASQIYVKNKIKYSKDISWLRKKRNEILHYENSENDQSIGFFNDEDLKKDSFKAYNILCKNLIKLHKSRKLYKNK